MPKSLDLSIVVPVFNEQENLALLYNGIVSALKELKLGFEIVFVDDGSTDQSFLELKALRRKDKRVKVIRFVKNFGQTFAWDAGIKNSRGKYIVTIDADLQNDPADIPLLFKKLQQGFDVVSGWRSNRRDAFPKRFFSFFANSLRRFLTGERIHDSGCSLKIYRRECFQGLDLYEGMRRFITAILSMKGFRVAEVKVRHYQRKHGETKYGPARLVIGFLELLMVVFLIKYSAKPLRLFGSLGIITFAAGFLLGLYLSFLKLLYGISLSNRPSLILSVLLVILGIQFIIFGILAELIIRLYFGASNSRPYVVREALK